MLYYIHGYESSPTGEKGTLFKKKLNAKAIRYRDCEPEEIIISNCLKRIAEEIVYDKDVVLIGSSLGGFLAIKTAFKNSNVKQIILFNPAIIPPSVDINTIKGMPMRILNEIKDYRLFKDKLFIKIMIFIGTEDKIIHSNWILEFAKAQEATVKFFQDDHRFSHYIDRLPEIITKVLDKKH